MSPPNMAPEAGRLELSWQVQLDLPKSMASDASCHTRRSRFLSLLGDSEPEPPKKTEMVSANWQRAGSLGSSMGSSMGLLGLVSPENCIIVQHANCPALRLHPRTEPSHISSCELAGYNATYYTVYLCFLLSHA
jgi:hypothetical protein